MALAAALVALVVVVEVPLPPVVVVVVPQALVVAEALWRLWQLVLWAAAQAVLLEAAVVEPGATDVPTRHVSTWPNC